MQRRHAAAAALAVLLALAGCASGPPGPAVVERGDDPAAQTEPTTTPAADDGTTDDRTTTPDANETPGDRVDLPPGVGLDGVTNASALVEAHREALAASGYRFVLRTNLSSGFAGGVEQWAVQNGTVAAGLSPFQFTTVTQLVFENESASPPASVNDAWGNDTAVAVRTRRGNVTQVQQLDRSAQGVGLGPGGPGGGEPASFDAALTQAAVVESVLRSGTFEVGNVRQDGDVTLVTLTATGLDEAAFGDVENVSRFEASLVVDEDGRVHSLDYELAYESADGPAVRYRYRLTDVGDVTVEKPPWVATAFAEGNASGGPGQGPGPGPGPDPGP